MMLLAHMIILNLHITIKHVNFVLELQELSFLLEGIFIAF